MQRQDAGNKLKSFLQSGSLLSVLIIVNVGVWVLSLFFPLVDFLYSNPKGMAKEGWLNWFALSSEWERLLLRPWTLLTYMFLHEGFWHILFNMLMLYFGGTMFCRFLGARRFGWVYFLSGIFGALLYLLVYNLFPVGRYNSSLLLGASAAVLGVFVAVAVYVPDETVQLWAIVRSFPVKMKHLAIAFVVLDLMMIPLSNSGGHIAHLGGALFGWLYVLVSSKAKSASRRTRASRWFSRSARRASQAGPSAYQKGRSRPLTDDEYNRRRAVSQKEIDAILDKISKSGYDNLTLEEKEKLFKFK